jgi:hypothetical protein
MRKLAVIVMMIALATVLPVTMASADDHHHWWGIQGTYATTGPGACLYSLSGFNSDLTVPSGGVSWIASKLAVGTWTFNRNGTGRAQDTVYGIAGPPYSSPTGDSAEISYDFTYSVAHDGTITVEMLPGTFVGTYATGPNAGKEPPRTFIVDKFLSFGKVSTDHKTLTLNSANEVQTFTIYRPDLVNQLLVPAICNYGRVLIRVSEVDD